MAYKKGESGNPAGKPPGARNHRTIFLEALKKNSSSELDFAAKLAVLATEGNSAALSVVASRVWRESKSVLPLITIDLSDCAGTYIR